MRQMMPFTRQQQTCSGNGWLSTRPCWLKKRRYILQRLSYVLQLSNIAVILQKASVKPDR